MKRLPRGLARKAWSIFPLVLLIPLMLSGCPPQVEENIPRDECFTGEYSNGNVTLYVVHHGGMVTASGWKTPTDDSPWESLYFNGQILRTGEASGELTVYFPPEGNNFPSDTCPDVRLLLASPDDPVCENRRTMQFSFSYLFNESNFTEDYTLYREG